MTIKNPVNVPTVKDIDAHIAAHKEEIKTLQALRRVALRIEAPDAEETDASTSNQ